MRNEEAMRKSARQLEAEIAEALSKTPARTSKRKQSRRSHLSKVSPNVSPKEQFVDLLMQRTDEAREIARDLLLEHGVIHRGRVESVRTIGNSSSGTIHEVTMNVGLRRPKIYWTVGPSSGYDIPEVGETVDFQTSKGRPPIAPTTDPANKSARYPKEQLYRYGGFRGDYPESIIRKWVAVWWPK